MDEQNRGTSTEVTNFEDAPPFPWDDAPKTEHSTPKKEIVQDITETNSIAEAQPLPEPVNQVPESVQQVGMMGNLKAFFGKLTKKRDLLQEIERIESTSVPDQANNILIQKQNAIPDSEFFEPEIQPATPDTTPNAELVELNTRLNSMEKELEDFRNIAETEPIAENTEGNEAIKLQISETSDAVSVLQEKINSVEENVNTFDDRRDDITESFEGVKNQIQEIIQLQTNQGKELKATIEETISRHENALETNSLLLETEITGIKNSQNEIKTEVSGLSNTIAGLMEDVAHVGKQGKENSNEIKKHEDDFNNEIKALKNFIDEEIKKTGSQGYFTGESVKLTKIVKNSTNTKICMEWLEFLMELVGRNNLPEILAYYEELEWISDAVRLELMRYAEGIDFYVEKPDWKLSPDDHVKSIWFIEKLAGVKVDKNQLSLIERDIKKVKGSNEIYGI